MKSVIFLILFCTTLLCVQNSAAEERAEMAVPPPGVRCYLKGQLQYHDENKKVKRRQPYCQSRKQFYLVNESCHRSRNCEALKTWRKPITIKRPEGPFANPLERICERFSGQPRYVELKHAKKWQRTSICEFKDGSFAGLAYWSRYVIQTAKPSPGPIPLRRATSGGGRD